MLPTVSRGCRAAATAAPQLLPHPPPPPSPSAQHPRAAANSCAHESDRSMVPPPTQGYVFCYPCIFNYVSDKKRCPITNSTVTPDQLRKIFPD